MQCSFSLFQKNFRMLVLCLTFPKAFMMTGNVVGRRLTMNGSYGSVGSARAAEKRRPRVPDDGMQPVRTENGLRLPGIRRERLQDRCSSAFCGGLCLRNRKRSCPGSFGRERFCGQKRRESQRRALVSQPLMPSEAIPRIRCFWRKRNRISSGRQVTTTPAIVRFSRLK